MGNKLIALPVYQERISPLFDVAKKYAIFEIDGKDIKQKILIDIPADSELSRIEKLKEIGVSVIICGAVSRHVSGIILLKDIELISWASGYVDEVINIFISGALKIDNESGCRHRKRNGQCRGKSWGINNNSYNTEGVVMKIAVSTEGKDLNSMVDPRFGRAKGFIIYNQESKVSEYIDNEQNLQAAQGAGIQAAKTVINAGAIVLITGNVGPKAHSALSSAGVGVFTCGQCTVQNAIDDYLAGNLSKASEANVEGHW